MIITSDYNKKEHTDKVWYESSNVYYSEFVEDETENKGDLYVTFKGGITYKYKDVIMSDYLLFKHGGLDGSQGKALNSFIKKKYEFEKMEEIKNIEHMEEEKQKTIIKEKESILEKTYFISGHRNVNIEEFELYKEKINKVINEVPNATFIMGDYEGVDILAQNYLIDDLNINPSQIVVYHMLEQPRNVNKKITRFVGGFKNDEERDSAMTLNSKHDIAYVRNHTEISGTAQNILRRNRFY